jgi:putative toxin-antitoxin system antitoxin component (TIGR02293 family)
MIHAASILGGRKVLRTEPLSPLEWVYMIRKGFPSKAMDSFGTNIGATNADLAQILGISIRALAWRRRKGVLTPSESERMFRVARVVGRAEEVFGDLTNGLEWMKSPNGSLSGVTPISLLDTDIGADWVMDALGRVEHGVFA